MYLQLHLTPVLLGFVLRLVFVNIRLIFCVIFCSCLHCAFHEIHFSLLDNKLSKFKVYLFQRGSKYFSTTFEVFVLEVPNISKCLDFLGVQLFQRGSKYFNTTPKRGLKYLNRGELFLGSMFLGQTVMLK